MAVALEIEENSYDFTVGLRPFRPFAFGVTGGLYQPNTGPGNDDTQIGDVFPPASIPGLIEQTDFLRGGFFVQFDNRDIPGTPRKGGNYAARFVYYDDRDLKRHSHRRLDLDAQHYIPFFNRKRVIALRAKTIMTFANGSAVVPFYMQPVLGGSDDLRGFRQWRFYDNNLIVATAEYRWEAFSGLDMALFFDAGKVTSRRSEITVIEQTDFLRGGFFVQFDNRDIPAEPSRSWKLISERLEVTLPASKNTAMSRPLNDSQRYSAVATIRLLS